MMMDRMMMDGEMDRKGRWVSIDAMPSIDERIDESIDESIDERIDRSIEGRVECTNACMNDE